MIIYIFLNIQIIIFISEIQNIHYTTRTVDSVDTNIKRIKEI